MNPMVNNGYCRFSTDDLPERDRAAIWRELCGRRVMRLEMDMLPGAAFHADIMVRTLPGLVTVTGTMCGIRQRRTRELLADSNDDLLLVMIRSGTGIATQFGRELMLSAGEAVLMTSAEIGAFTSPAAGAQTVVLRMGRAALGELVGAVEDALMSPIPRGSEALQLLTNYVGVLNKSYALAAAELRHLTVAHVHDLVASTLGATAEAAALAEGRGIRAARLQAMKADIIARLGHPDFTVASVAARHGLTLRQIQRLFETEGTTFSEFVLNQRLTQARRLLADPRFADRAISAIAYKVGFGDLSYFNRTFRRRYGVTPSDVRVAAGGFAQSES
jgi:AraC-like DNA-binding protein